ncbi:MAG: HmuY family protein, partial [Myxococcota bacterium]|nr:HmuY family protein [Myxococcota bacterium]
WDMALRRFIVRLNGGSSGPSCVGAAALLESDYDALEAVPDGIVYASDAYYTDDCTIVNDSSGLPGSPQVSLGSWWEYDGCVQTTGVPHLIALSDGHVIKVRVEAYYAEDQDGCNDNGAPGIDSGVFTLRWQYLS